MDHPIAKFINELFPSKESQKRQKWINWFIDNEYDDVEQLNQISDEDWKESQLPKKIISDIKKKLASDKKEIEKKDTPETKESVDQKEASDKGQNCEKKENNEQESTQKNEDNEQKKNNEQKENNEKKENNKQKEKENNEQKENNEKKQNNEKKECNEKKESTQKKEKNEKRENNENNDEIGKVITLSSHEKKQLCQLMNMDMPQLAIIQFFGETPTTPRGEVIMQEMKYLIRPPKPAPVGCKSVRVKIQEKSLPLYLYNGKQLPITKYYTLLVVGQTGTGKTTLLDAFVNKLTGMQFTDNWRWKLVNEDHLLHIGGKASQTSEITTYYVNDINNRFNVRIIDTPGFGDTKGIQADNEIVGKFQQLFQNVQEIDYILLTIKASQTRLGPASKYVFDRVQQIFGVDAKDRFALMCTFADGTKPVCLTTIDQQNIVYDKYFCFNNNHLYTPSDKGNKTSKTYWKMAMESIQQFQDYVVDNSRSPLSLKLSKEVLQTRKYLEASIKTSQQSYKSAQRELDVAKRNFHQLKQNKKQIEQNGSYTSSRKVQKIKYQNLGKTVQMCNRCKVTCCQICTWPPNCTYSACTYFSNGRGCPKCPGGCPREAHIRSDDLIIKEEVIETTVIDCKKQAYQQGLSGAENFNSMLKKNLERIESAIQIIWKYGNDIKVKLKQLQNIALQPKMWNDEDFYNQMILQEEERKEDGYVDRVTHLRETLTRMKDFEKMKKIATIDTLFPQIKDLKKQYENEKGASQLEKMNCQIY